MAFQSDSLGGPDGAEFKIMLVAQLRALRVQIDNYDNGLDTEDAPPLLDEIRADPWTGGQTAALSQSWHRAVSKKHLALNPSLVDRTPQSLNHIELFGTDALWEVALHGDVPRSKRLVSISWHLMKMDMTSPDTPK